MLDYIRLTLTVVLVYSLTIVLWYIWFFLSFSSRDKHNHDECLTPVPLKGIVSWQLTNRWNPPSLLINSFCKHYPGRKACVRPSDTGPVSGQWPLTCYTTKITNHFLNTTAKVFSQSSRERPGEQLVLLNVSKPRVRITLTTRWFIPHEQVLYSASCFVRQITKILFLCVVKPVLNRGH